MPEVLKRVAETTPFDFGAEMKAAREARGLTREQLGITVQLRPATLSNYEIGFTLPAFLNAIKIMNAVGLPLERLNHWEEAKDFTPSVPV